MLEIEYLGPRIPEIGYPWQSCLARESKAYHVHRLRRSRAYDQIYRMLGEILLQKFHRRADPEASRIGTEKIASHPHCSFLQKRFVLGIDRIDLHRLLAVSRTSQQFLVEFVRLDDAGLHDLGSLRHFCRERLIHGQLFWVLGSVNHRLPSL